MHQLTASEFEMILATVQTVFPQVHLFRNDLKASNINMALVAFKDRELDWDVVRRRCLEERAAGLLGDPLCRHAEGVAMLYLGVAPQVDRGVGINSMANLSLEVDAARELLIPRPGQYFSYEEDGNLWMSFVNHQLSELKAASGQIGELALLPELGFLVTRAEIAHAAEDPFFPTLGQQVKTRFPQAVLADENADWSLWAGGEPTRTLLKPGSSPSPTP